MKGSTTPAASIKILLSSSMTTRCQFPATWDRWPGIYAALDCEPGYQRAKGNVEHTLERIPLIGRPVRDGIRKGKAVLKQILYNSTIFEDLGFHYYGPFDGHDLPQLLEVLENTKSIPKPVLLHVITSKGKGYPFAERHPGTFHGVSGFDIETGQAPPSGKSFSMCSEKRSVSWRAATRASAPSLRRCSSVRG